MALAGHVSKSMLARYSHIRQAAKQAAIEALEAVQASDSKAAYLQFSLQSPTKAAEQRFTIPEKSLN
jgi:hypothetical protein